MVRQDFDRDLRLLEDELLMLGNMVEKAVDRSIEGLRSRDLELCREVIEQDDIIDEKRYEVEERTINLIATQQPAAGDLRILVTFLHVAGELERMGDYCEGIAKIASRCGPP